MAEMHPQSSVSEPGASQNTKSTNHFDQNHRTETFAQPSFLPPNPSKKLTPKLKSTFYAPPFIIHPLSTHLQSIIILHGRGSSASAFGPPLLSTPVSPLQCPPLLSTPVFPLQCPPLLSTPVSPLQSQTLHTAFPHAKFIFPTASKRRAVVYNRASINQWFDNWSLTEPTEREELQIEGLRESSAYIHSLLREEIEIVGAGNVVLGGLSQGCAASLVALLMWEGKPLGAAFGMCGWLPFRKQMEEIAQPRYDGDDEDDPFERSSQSEKFDPPAQAVEFCARKLGLRSYSHRCRFNAHHSF